jgi:hypothetical protein
MNRERWASIRPASCDPDDLARARAAGYEADASEAYFVGRDPRRMTTAELEAMGHQRRSPTEAIRAKCLDCCAGSANEVRGCVAVTCPSWPFRMGASPWKVPRQLTEEQREAMRERGRILAHRTQSGALG